MREKGFMVVLYVILALLMIPFSVRAEIYKWVDEKGGIHFTDDHSTIPEKYNEKMERRSLPEDSKPTAERTQPAEEKKSESKGYGTWGASEILLLFSGLISMVSDSGRSIAVTAGEKEMVFTVFEDTSAKTDSGQKVSLGELKNGMSATVEYVKEGDNNRARSIKVALLLAGTPNAVEGSQDGKENQSAPGKMQNPGETQKRTWQNQKAHKRSTK
jgi:hypothetical protein